MPKKNGYGKTKNQRSLSHNHMGNIKYNAFLTHRPPEY